MIRLSALTILLIIGSRVGAQAIHPRPGNPNAGPVVQVSGESPFPASCNAGQNGANTHNGTVEPFVAVDPNLPDHLVGGWQQDRWSNGGASGVMAAMSNDRGQTWSLSTPHFSVCAGGPYLRASDPWVAIAKDGAVHYAALGVDNVATAVLVSRSGDGGLTWSEPVTVDRDPAGGDDKETITADPTDSRYVYLVWDRASAVRAQSWFARSSDGGLTWGPARMIYDPGAQAAAVFHQIVVTPDGTLVDIFVLQFDRGGPRPPGTWVASMRSRDHGDTWSAPILVSTDGSIGTVNPKTQTVLRVGAGLPNTSVDPISGAIYVVWPDARFSDGARDGIALSKSMDGGLSWSEPVQVNQAQNVQAFTPAVAAASAGRVAVTYYDFRQDTDDKSTLFASRWRALSVDGGVTWRETPVSGPFDMLSAPKAGNSPFLGDYQGLAVSGDRFVEFFVTANSGNAANPSSVLATSLEREGSTRSNPRTEVNLHPQAFRALKKPEPEPNRKRR